MIMVLVPDNSRSRREQRRSARVLRAPMAFKPYDAFLIDQLTNPIGVDAPGNIKLALAIVRRPNALVGQRGAAAAGLADRV
jgi:hypothetical protein